MTTDIGTTVTSLPDDGSHLASPSWLIPAYLVVAITGVIGNSLVIIILASVREMRSTATNLLILHQSVIDLTSAVLMLVVLFSEAILAADYIMPMNACRVWFSRYPVWSCFMVSTINLMALTLERYHAILRPLHHRTVCSPGRVIKFFPFCWVAGFVLLSYLIVMSDVYYGRYCLLARFEGQGVQQVIGVLTVIFFYLIPLSVMVFTYSSILREVKRKWRMTSPENDNQNPRAETGTQLRLEKNILKVLALVVVVYAICWSPNQILYLYFSLGGHLDFAGHFYHWTVVMVTCNMSINPIVYALKYHQFRDGFVKVFCRQGCRASVNVSDVSE